MCCVFVSLSDYNDGGDDDDDDGDYKDYHKDKQKKTKKRNRKAFTNMTMYKRQRQPQRQKNLKL